ncbi:hypothetical protein [Actinoplanes sp. ATCC 53533]|uniref:hypothetical protein n=1 Tax=Actinoplanes sp. ATCC 53533 TaxID=1288362 RepID=UPI000F7995BF|nr:hypothetical protein [Actinoplanes sp. ATCC 53533]
MTAILMAAAAALPGASSAGSAGLTAAPVNTRAMWLWDADPAAQVIAWATRQNVSEVFVHVAPSVLTDGSLARLQEIKERAVDGRIELRALGGEPGWINNHAAALDWQRTVVSTGLFDGIHLDVEPYLTDGWTTDLPAARAAYLRLLDRMRAASTLRLEADVPFWFGRYKIGRNTLADEVLRRVDGVTVMSYRDTATGPNSMLAVSQDWLARGRTAGKRVRLAAETGPLPDCPHCTFHEEGADALTTELAKVDAATRLTAAFGGIAVHHYGAWRTLPARPSDRPAATLDRTEA